MKTTGLFTIHEYEIHIKKLREPVYIVPVGDIHKFSPGHSSDKWSEFLETYSQMENVYLFGMGDYMDLMSASERLAFMKAEFHDSTQQTFDDVVKKMVEEFAKDLEPFKGRIIGLIEGNHYYNFQWGETSTQMLCRLLGCKYLGVATFTRLSFIYNKDDRVVRDVWAHHGKGAARFLGGSLKRVEDMAMSASADIFIMAHDHKMPIGKRPQLKLSTGGGSLTVQERMQIFMRSGSFLRGYVPDMVSYVADGALEPSMLGNPEIKIIPMKKFNNHFHLDIRASI